VRLREVAAEFAKLTMEPPRRHIGPVCLVTTMTYGDEGT
jgi:hypothetical protein